MPAPFGRPHADYALYVTFFPQLIAGPIVRHGEIIHQYALDPMRHGLHERLARGFLLLLFGLVKKVVFADELTEVVDPLFQSAADGATLDTAQAWMATAAFGLQIYFDFSGYSDMAIGLAMMFGLALPINFNAPYASCSLREFWRRWHMTLSRFLRDYLYIPIGGNRYGPVRELAALMVTMLLGGLWHGAAWTFVAWGGLQGIGLAVNHAWRRLGYELPRLLGWGITMTFVFFAWVLFRSPDFPTAWSLFGSLLGAEAGSVSISGSVGLEGEVWLLPVAALLAVLGPTSQRLALELAHPRPMWAAATGAGFAVMLVFIGGWRSQEFIYFQF